VPAQLPVSWDRLLWRMERPRLANGLHGLVQREPRVDLAPFAGVPPVRQGNSPSYRFPLILSDQLHGVAEGVIRFSRSGRCRVRRAELRNAEEGMAQEGQATGTSPGNVALGRKEISAKERGRRGGENALHFIAREKMRCTRCIPLRQCNESFAPDRSAP